MNRKLSDTILNRLNDYYGTVEPDLKYRNLYELSVAVILSAQTTDRQVNSVTGILFMDYPDFPSLAAASISDVENAVRSTGFYRNKARHIIGLAKSVENKYGGTLPDSMSDLLTLPGIGRKSANVILSMGFNRPALAVDTHVLRIANRTGYVDTRDALRAEMALTSLIPEHMWTRTHLLMIRHGRSICHAKKPECGICPINDLCPSAYSIQ